MFLELETARSGMTVGYYETPGTKEILSQES